MYFIPENIQKNLDGVRQEEAEFERSYSDWLKQYNDWRDANKSRCSLNINTCNCNK